MPIPLKRMISIKLNQGKRIFVIDPFGSIKGRVKVSQNFRLQFLAPIDSTKSKELPKQFTASVYNSDIASI